jgi:hypothetical protein
VLRAVCFLVYIYTLSELHRLYTVQRQNVYDEQGKTWKAEVVAHFEVLFQNLRGGTDKNYVLTDIRFLGCNSNTRPTGHEHKHSPC